jgi:putative hydrolase of HD superfamily
MVHREADWTALEAFALLLDRLKGVERRNYLLDRARRENTAEHSWHVALVALTLRDYATPGADPERAALMLLFHDVPEILVGDTYLYDRAGQVGKAAREDAAAWQILAGLPLSAQTPLGGLWEEFTGGETPTARYARAIDRLLPLLYNYSSGGGNWQENGVSAEMVEAWALPELRRGTPGLVHIVESMVEDAVLRGLLSRTAEERGGTRDG